MTTAAAGARQRAAGKCAQDRKHQNTLAKQSKELTTAPNNTLEVEEDKSSVSQKVSWKNTQLTDGGREHPLSDQLPSVCAAGTTSSL